MLRNPVLALLLLAAIPFTACKRSPELASRVRDRITFLLPAVRVEIVDSATLQIVISERHATLSLDNLTILCSQEPARCNEAIDQMVRNLEQATAQAPATQDTLRVVLRSRDTVDEYLRIARDSSPESQPVTFPFQADLLQVLVRDTPHGIAVATRGDLATMKLDPNAARQRGLANLEEDAPSITGKTIAPGVLHVRVGDNYEAARILLPKAWDTLAAAVTGELVVVAPTRDDVFATGSADRACLAKLESLAKQAFEAGPYSLSTALLRHTDAGFVAFSPPD